MIKDSFHSKPPLKDPFMSRIFKQNQDVALSELGISSSIMVIAIGWENKVKTGLVNRVQNNRHDCDLDLSCVMYDQENEKLDTVWYAQLQSECGGVRHKGDETAGVERGDDETITLNLNQINPETKTMFFVISSFTGNQFAHVENCYWRLYDPVAQRELGRFNFPGNDKASAKIVMRMQKAATETGLPVWTIRALDEFATGKNIQEILPEIRDLLDA